MASLLSMTYINELLDKHNITFKKSLGQNFLIDKNALDRILLAANLGRDDSIILKKYAPACLFCGNATDVQIYKGRKVCKECIEAMTAKLEEETEEE